MQNDTASEASINSVSGMGRWGSIYSAQFTANFTAKNTKNAFLAVN